MLYPCSSLYYRRAGLRFTGQTLRVLPDRKYGTGYAIFFLSPLIPIFLGLRYGSGSDGFTRLGGWVHPKATFKTMNTGI
jgi:hypothetical protein